MNLEQVLIGLAAGGFVGFQAVLLAAPIKLRVMEALIFGILGAFFGSGLLDLLTSHNTDILSLWLASLLGAVLSVALFAILKTRWYWARLLRQKQVWSFVDPFEE